MQIALCSYLKTAVVPSSKNRQANPPFRQELLERVSTVSSALFVCLGCLWQACTGPHLFGCYLGIWPFGETCPPSW